MEVAAVSAWLTVQFKASASLPVRRWQWGVGTLMFCWAAVYVSLSCVSVDFIYFGTVLLLFTYMFITFLFSWQIEFFVAM